MMLLHVLDGGPVTPATIWRRWQVEPAALALIVLSGVWYALGVRRLWASAGQGRGVTTVRIVAFYLGLLTLLIALCSPLDALADSLFSAHMVQHVVLIGIAPPLLLFGLPAFVVLWGFPHDARVRVGRAWAASRIGRVLGWLTLPAVGWVVHTLALWLWHIPTPYALALEHPAVHAVEHACFLLSAMLVWWIVLRPMRDPRAGALAAVLVMLGTFVQSGALGAILTFSSTPWYYAQSVAAGAWHLTALEDQQLAGLIMWIPAGFIYVGAALLTMRHWLVEPKTEPASAATLVVVHDATGDVPVAALPQPVAAPRYISGA